MRLTIGRVGRRASVGLSCRRRGTNHGVSNFSFGFGRGIGRRGVRRRHSPGATSLFAGVASTRHRLFNRGLTRSTHIRDSCDRLVKAKDCRSFNELLTSVLTRRGRFGVFFPLLLRRNFG